MHNPLKRPILAILKKQLGSLKEYELHSLLGGAAFEQFTQGCSHDLSLFRQHFLVMNALYELHDDLLAQGMLLNISALDIQLQKLNQTAQQELATDSAFEKLSAYYQDWQNFSQTDDKGVAELLQQFWQDYLAYDEKDQALLSLGFTAEKTLKTISWSEIQQQYRRLCQAHHPDKGGDVLRFVEIRQAYENLKQVYTR